MLLRIIKHEHLVLVSKKPTNIAILRENAFSPLFTAWENGILYNFLCRNNDKVELLVIVGIPSSLVSSIGLEMISQGSDFASQIASYAYFSVS